MEINDRLVGQHFQSSLGIITVGILFNDELNSAIKKAGSDDSQGSANINISYYTRAGNGF